MGGCLDNAQALFVQGGGAKLIRSPHPHNKTKMSNERIIKLGDAEVTFPSVVLGQIEDSSDLYKKADFSGLRSKLEEDGFLYLKGVLGRDSVLDARAVVIRGLVEKGDVLLDQNKSVLLEACNLGCLPNMEGVNSLTHSKEMLNVLEGSSIRNVVGAALGVDPQQTKTFDYKWLRAVGRTTFTGVHCDSVYMSRGSSKLLTCWIPIEENATLELGALAMCKGSHKSKGLQRLRATYGKFDTEAEPGFEGSGWFTNDPLEISRMDPEVQWVAGDYEAGDMLIFTLLTLHCSTANLTDRVRISCDIRYQPADEIIDDRYMGTAEEMKLKAAERKKGGAYSATLDSSSSKQNTVDIVSIEDLKARWGFRQSTEIERITGL